MDVPFTQEELGFLFGAVKESLEQVKSTDKRTRAELDGLIYTNLRRQLRTHGPSSLFNLVKGKKKDIWRGRERWFFLERMIDDMKTEHLKQNEDSLKELRLALAGMDDANRQLKRINEEGEKVIEGVARIHKILNPLGGNEDGTTG